jgi:hypothetical protein
MTRPATSGNYIKKERRTEAIAVQTLNEQHFNPEREREREREIDIWECKQSLDIRFSVARAKIAFTHGLAVCVAAILLLWQNKNYYFFDKKNPLFSRSNFTQR